MIISRHAVFLEKDLILQKDSGSQEELREIIIEDSQIEDTQTRNDEASGSNSKETPEPRRSGRISRQPDRYYGFYLDEGEIHIITNREPDCYEEVLTNVDKDKWLEAMKSEMDSMYENQVWTEGNWDTE